MKPLNSFLLGAVSLMTVSLTQIDIASADSELFPTGSDNPSKIELTKDSDGWKIVFTNKLSSGPTECPFCRPDYLYLKEPEVGRVKVVLDEGDGMLPDVIRVIAPEGFIAIPEEIKVQENSHGTIRLWPNLIG